MIRSGRPRWRLMPVALAVGVAAPACGSADPGSTLPAPAAEGRQISHDSGCVACHGSDGEGGVGPAWVGLPGSRVELADGATVTVDREYLRRAITDPGAETVAGFTIAMPDNALTEDEVEAVISYIEALG